MKNKKLLSTILAATLAATTMAMPVMAQDGTIDVDIKDKDYILRVQVPTKLAVEIDPYEIALEGSQIYSGQFEMTNYSQVNVEVKVDSKLAKANGSNYALVSSKKAAKDSTSTSGDAWLAIAAKTSANGDASGDAYKEGTANNYAELTETNKNVTTFDISGDASQTFYLAQASGDATTPVYRQVVPTTAGESGTPYAQFYELQADASITDATTLENALKQKDIFVAASGDAVNLTKISKDTTGATFTSGDTCYALKDGSIVEESSLAAGTPYMYSEMQQEGGAAGFRYIGNLSNKKSGGWSKDDFSSITINYTIKGVPQSEFTEKDPKCTYGLYAEENGVEVAAASVTNGEAAIRLVTGQNAVANKITSVKVDGTATTNYSVASSGAILIKGVTAKGSHTIIIVYDGTTYKGTVTVA